MTRTRICVVFGLELAPPGGAERLVLEEARFLAARGHDVTLAVPRYDEDYLSEVRLPDAVTVVVYGDPRHRLPGARRIRRVLRAASPDVVFTHYTEQETGVALATLPTDPPTVSHVHGSVLWFPEDARHLPHRRRGTYDELVAAVPGHREFHGDPRPGVRERLRVECWERVKGRVLRETDAVFTGSNRVATELRGLYGATPEVVRPGVSRSWLDRYEAVQTRTLTDHEHTVLSVSRLDSRKRLGVLVEAVGRVRDRGRDVGLVLCGTGDDEARLRDAVADGGLDDHVRFEGYVAESDLPAYYTSADAFACPAWMSYGLAPLEAYGMRTPVGLSTDTYVKEILGDAPAVRVADPDAASWADALESLLDTGETPDASRVPTWDEFCEEKYRELVRRGVLPDGDESENRPVTARPSR
ncbi:glycosyltransferase family 4 protein [Halogeometricum limi]|uniref:Glycosyltransferase involved in cell wall bisynthesis n=1 Tax=Halogeometricum limi TaxID=555875 RepID=A0A1I6HTQ3_9EURY|nr:glycosyltransferase family 4 protein [Halogeometricum limi]SFR57814.1 Glycosyltransferase involved in cell wall bisynthesis [Halogeometricum limi]